MVSRFPITRALNSSIMIAVSGSTVFYNDNSKILHSESSKSISGIYKNYSIRLSSSVIFLRLLNGYNIESTILQNASPYVLSNLSLTSYIAFCFPSRKQKYSDGFLSVAKISKVIPNEYL